MMNYLCFYLILNTVLSCSVCLGDTDNINSNLISKRDSLVNYNLKLSRLNEVLSGDFILIPHSYFIIASDLTESEIKKIISSVIDKATFCFYNNFLDKRPDEVITVFLFKDKYSYEHWAYKLFNDYDLSPYGYYKPTERTLLMNISTGSGTLVHELTHALVDFDFPDIPAWFNEGMGSLYEKCSFSMGEIRGHVNWRLPVLKKALTTGKYTSLEKLIKSGRSEFYGNNSAFNYSQARYLCMYLQETGILKQYYRKFRDSYNTDACGMTQLEEITGMSISELENKFLKWIETIEYYE
jgi:hypothetical protein